MKKMNDIDWAKLSDDKVTELYKFTRCGASLAEKKHR